MEVYENGGFQTRSRNFEVENLSFHDFEMVTMNMFFGSGATKQRAFQNKDDQFNGPEILNKKNLVQSPLSNKYNHFVIIIKSQAYSNIHEKPLNYLGVTLTRAKECFA